MTIVAPIKSPRLLYRIGAISVNLDEDQDAIDAAPGQTAQGLKRPIYVLMKESIGNWLNLQPLPYNAPELTALFNGHGLNRGSKFRRRLGGYRVASYTLLSKTEFEIAELIKQLDGTYKAIPRKFKAVGIGLPKGHSVNEFIDWIGVSNRATEIKGIRTPAGRLIPFTAAQVQTTP